jgi:hypothetical protein
LTEALRLVENSTSIYKASKITNVPETTIKDRIAGRVSRDNFTTGHPTIFSKEEEKSIQDHAVEMSQMGYGYSRREFLGMINEMAKTTNKINNDQKITEGWLYLGFLKQNKELKFLKSRSLCFNRAKSVTPLHISNYFNNLENILSEHNLKDRPELIYNIDETGFSPEHVPPKILALKGSNPQSVISPRSTMTTCIRACNAMSNSIPPFLIIKGKRILDNLKEGASTGCNIVMSDYGWLNSKLFKTYLENHFLKYVSKKENKKILLLLDGSTTHTNPEVKKWTENNGIILFVLPPHSSHLLQPLDVGCFSPLKKCFNSLCHTYMKKKSRATNQ